MLFAYYLRVCIDIQCCAWARAPDPNRLLIQTTPFCVLCHLDYQCEAWNVGVRLEQHETCLRREPCAWHAFNLPKYLETIASAHWHQIKPDAIKFMSCIVRTYYANKNKNPNDQPATMVSFAVAFPIAFGSWRELSISKPLTAMKYWIFHFMLLFGVV